MKFFDMLYTMIQIFKPSLYAGAFLDEENKEELLKIIKPIHKNVKADHLTLKFGIDSDYIKNFEFGKNVELKVVGVVSDDKGQAVSVETNLSENKNPHITISIIDDVKVVYSNELIENNLIEKIETPIILSARLGISDGRKVFFEKPKTISKIILPVRPQPDTVSAIYLLKTFGTGHFLDIDKAKVEFLATLPEGDNHSSLLDKGILLVDVGGGIFDHHNKEEKTTASALVANYLCIEKSLYLQKLLEYTYRDDVFGKGTISDDQLDRAFGLSGLISALNKLHDKNPEKVVDYVLPLIEAHVSEEKKRAEDMPNEVEEKIANGQATTFTVKQRDKKLKVIIIESDNTSLPGFLRSKLGGSYDVVAQRTPTGHVNILTRPTKRIDLRSLVATIRASELLLKKIPAEKDSRKLMITGRYEPIPEWYYDTATNSIQNGGTTPGDTKPTLIPKQSLSKILEVGLSEKFLTPMRPN
jgi:hypothetical protein